MATGLEKKARGHLWTILAHNLNISSTVSGYTSNPAGSLRRGRVTRRKPSTIETSPDWHEVSEPNSSAIIDPKYKKQL
jgi:hypothetical protein